MRIGVALRSDPQHSGVEDAEGGGQDALASQVATPQIAGDAPPGGGQGRREVEHPIELDPILLLPPRRVVEVLESFRRVAARRLDVPVRMRRDPHVGPRGGNHERRGSGATLGVGGAAALVDEREATSATNPMDARTRDVTAAESGHPVTLCGGWRHAVGLTRREKSARMIGATTATAIRNALPASAA